MYEHNALGYWSGLALCLTKVRSSRARCPATALICFFFFFRKTMRILVSFTCTHIFSSFAVVICLHCKNKEEDRKICNFKNIHRKNLSFIP